MDGSTRQQKRYNTLTDKQLMDKQAASTQQAVSVEIQALVETIKKLETELFDAREIISSVKALDRVLRPEEKVVIFNTLLREHLESESSASFLFWPRDDVFRLSEATNLPKKYVEGLEFPRKNGLFWELVCQGEVFTSQAPDGSVRFEKTFEDFELDLSELEIFVPLAISGTPIGFTALSVSDVKKCLENSYVPRFAAQAAPSIHTAMLNEINRQDKVALDKTLVNLRMLYDVGRMMNHISELKELLKFILNEACKTTSAQKGSLMLFDENLYRIKVSVVQGLPDKLVEEQINSGEIECKTFAIGEGVAGTVFKNQSPLIVNNVKDADNFHDKKGSNVDSILCIPLVANDESIGVINITNKEGSEGFSEEDQKLILAMGSQAAAAIHRAKLYNLAIKDELTGLYIRRFFTHRLQEEIRRANRYKLTFSLIMIDIDHFKDVNDTFGHAIGDKALIFLARKMEAALRGPDVPCRYGGEEFIILLPETGVKEAKLVAERLRSELEKNKVAEMGRPITISLGVSTFPQHGEEATELMNAADMALYAAKEEGRNRVVVWDEEGGHGPVQSPDSDVPLENPPTAMGLFGKPSEPSDTLFGTQVGDPEPFDTPDDDAANAPDSSEAPSGKSPEEPDASDTPSGELPEISDSNLDEQDQ